MLVEYDSFGIFGIKNVEEKQILELLVSLLENYFKFNIFKFQNSISFDEFYYLYWCYFFRWSFWRTSQICLNFGIQSIIKSNL